MGRIDMTNILTAVGIAVAIIVGLINESNSDKQHKEVMKKHEETMKNLDIIEKQLLHIDNKI